MRKLEYIVPDVLASGADTLVSIGGIQSNHTRQVAAVAAHLGMKARLVQEKWVPWDDPVNDKVGNILLSRMMGADVRLDPSGFDIGIRESWEDAIREVEESGGTPYPIPAGASEHPLGGLGFANWAFEVAEQEKALGVHFDTIVVCTVTGSTHAGMIAGFAALEEQTGVRRRVLGIDASATLAKTTDQVARIARHTAELIELGRDLRDDEIQVLEGWAGDLYGIPVDSTMEAMRLGAELEAMITDPVYEGKSLAGLIDLVKGGDIPRDSHRALRASRRAAGAERLPLTVVVADHTQGLESVPRPSSSTLDVVAGREVAGRVEADADPAGVPVAITSPGSRATVVEIVSISVGMSKIRSATGAAWRCSPFTAGADPQRGDVVDLVAGDEARAHRAVRRRRSCRGRTARAASAARGRSGR